MVSCRWLHDKKNHSFNQFDSIKRVILLFSVTVCTTMSIERRKKTRELTEEVTHKIIAKLGQSQGYNSISRDLDVPVSTVRNVIRKFKAHGTAANLRGRGGKRKLDQRLQGRSVHLNQLPNRFKLIFRHKVWQFQLTQSVTKSMKVGSMVGDKGGPHRWDRDRRKPNWSLPKHTWTNQNPSGRMSCG